MNALTRILALAALTFAAMSCSSISKLSHSASNDFEEFSKQWEGTTHGDIVRAFGAPAREASDGEGGRILIYENIKHVTKTDVETYHGRFDPEIATTSNQDRSYREFFIDRDGKCYLVRTNIPTSKTIWKKNILYTMAIAVPWAIAVVIGTKSMGGF